MAKVANNIITEGLSGTLGGKLVFRTHKSGETIVGVRPSGEREFNAAQLAQQDAFRQAAAYAKEARTENIYIEMAEASDLSAYNIAMADWFNEPEIPALDLNAWNGGAGQLIRIQAVDDVQVISVRVEITDGNGTVFEQGQATQQEGPWWTYMTTVPTNGSRRLNITVQDRPGHTAQTTWQNN